MAGMDIEFVQVDVDVFVFAVLDDVNVLMG